MNAKKAKNNNSSGRRATKRRRLRARLRRRVRNRRLRNRMPAAYTKSIAKMFKIISQDGNSMRVRGRDLVYSIPEDIVSTYQESNVITVIPCNPCYWTGTRVSAIANGYQNYRPLKFNVHYIPQCAVTQQGNVLAGTLWNQTPSFDNLQQSLRTSSGGIMTQCYKSAKSVVSLKSNLPYNLFRNAGKFDSTSNPFLYIALAIGCTNTDSNKIIPGYFYVEWEYLFKNPIGYSTVFANSGLSKLEELDLSYSNCTLVSAQRMQNKGIEVGMIIQVDLDNENKYTFTYNDTVLDITDQSDLIVWCFQNRALNQEPVEPKKEVKVYYNNKSVSQNNTGIASHNTLIWFNPVSEVINFLTNASPEGQQLPSSQDMPVGTEIYMCNMNTQNDKNSDLPYSHVSMDYTSFAKTMARLDPEQYDVVFTTA